MKMTKTTTDQPAAAVEIPTGKQAAGAVAVVQAARKVLTFRERCYEISFPMLKSMVGEERAKEASGRVSAALAASRAAARDPKDFDLCTVESIGRVVAISALTGIYPGTGATALAYAIPRRPRQGEDPQLTYQLSHRGLNALANRAGAHMVAIPISHSDQIEVTETGDVVIRSMDLDNPPTTESELRGVVVLVKRLDTGTLVYAGWVPKKLIHERRDVSDSYKYAESPKGDWSKGSSPWHAWYTPQAMKTAMHYAIARGWCVIDDTDAQRALSADVESDIIDVESRPLNRVKLTRNELPAIEGPAE
jgi:hypothetical protein